GAVAHPQLSAMDAVVGREPGSAPSFPDHRGLRAGGAGRDVGDQPGPGFGAVGAPQLGPEILAAGVEDPGRTHHSRPGRSGPEPPVAARPGRVDLAVEIPLPDAECRRRLLELYGSGLDLRIKDEARLIRKTEGVSAAFIRELLRKAALLAADGGGTLVVRDAHLDAALKELLVEGRTLTRSRLGAGAAAPRH